MIPLSLIPEFLEAPDVNNFIDQRFYRLEIESGEKQMRYLRTGRYSELLATTESGVLQCEMCQCVATRYQDARETCGIVKSEKCDSPKEKWWN